jgi:hypothetical protein
MIPHHAYGLPVEIALPSNAFSDLWSFQKEATCFRGLTSRTIINQATSWSWKDG